MNIKFIRFWAVVPALLPFACNRAPEAPKSGPAVVTREEFKQVKPGMALEEVQRVIGDPGKELSKGDMPGRTLQTRSWNNPDGSGVTVSFENGKVTTVAPINLL